MKRARGWSGLSGVRNRARISAAALALAMAAPALAQEQTISFDITSQPLASALLELGRQARVSIAVPSDLAGGRTAPSVQGDFSLRQALDRLLADSGLRYEFVQADAVRIYREERASLAPAAASGDDAGPGARDLIVVTGTNLRGVAPDSSPVQIYSAKDIEDTGATTTEQFIQKLPQNLAKTSQYALGRHAGAEL